MDKPLTPKQQAFVEHFLTCWNETEAARRAGYADPNRNAHRLMVNNGISQAIQARLADLKMGSDEVLARISDHARGSLRPFIRRTPDGDLRGFDLSDDRPLHLIHKVSLTTRTMKDDVTEEKITLELYDAQSALALLGKHHKLFGDTGGVLKSLDLSKLSKEQVQRIADGEDPIAVLLSTDTDQSTGGAGAT